MGLSFRKSIKLFGNTRLNFSKNGGVGLSTGIKHARISCNKKGVRTTIGKDGLQYRKDYSLNENKLEHYNRFSRIKLIASNLLKTVIKPINFILIKILDVINIILKRANKNNRMLNNHTEVEVEAFKKEHYTTHMKLIFGGLPCIVIGFILPPILLIGFILVVSGIVCMIKNRKRINSEYKIRISK